MRTLLVVALLTSTAFAGGPSTKQVQDSLRTFDDADSATPRFGFDSLGVHANEKRWQDTNKDVLDLVKLEKVAVTSSADGTAAWATFRLRRAMQCAGLKGRLEQCESSDVPAVNMLLVLERDGKKWVPVTSHSGAPISDGDVNAKLVAGMKLAAIPKQTSDAASDAVAMFSSTIGSPAKLSASVAANATLIGSSNEMLSGAKVAASLKKWNLAFTALDGIASGATSSGTVAWVAANVSATSADPKAPAKKQQYRMMCLYEKQKAGWKLVAITFSFPFQPPA